MNNTKSGLVREIFSSVAIKYDLMNDIMSFGIHRLWKDELCNKIPNLNGTILDVACGSGDIALRIIKKARLRNKTPQLVMLDVNNEMLNQARAKFIDNNILENVDFICANGENLPLKDNSVDYYIIAFGIRNFTNINAGLKEALRVLKPGGKFLCLEFSKVEHEYLKLFYNFYSFNIIPNIGKIIANNKDAYQYLVESINQFPDQESFKAMIYEAGFTNTTYKNLSFGISAIHSAYKL